MNIISRITDSALKASAAFAAAINNLWETKRQHVVGGICVTSVLFTLLMVIDGTTLLFGGAVISVLMVITMLAFPLFLLALVFGNVALTGMLKD